MTWQECWEISISACVQLCSECKLEQEKEKTCRKSASQ